MSIKPFLSIRTLAALAAAASLVACANPSGGQDHAEHHPGQSADTAAAGSSGAPPAQAGMMGSGMAGSQGGCGMMGSQAGCGMMGSSQAGSQAAGAGGMQGMNKEQMCAMYRSMRDAPNEQARQTMMDQRMQGMSPEMRQQHMEMMRQQCQ